MKKTLLTILVLIVLLISGLLIWRYINYSRDPDPYKSFFLPRVGISVIEITSLAVEKTDMNVSVLIKNILPFSFTADSFEYELYMNDAEIMRSRYSKKISLLANDSSWIKLPVTVFTSDADSLITANEKRKIDSAEYRMHASFYTDILFNKKYNVTIKRYLPLVHIPHVDVKKIEVDSLNAKRAYVLVHTEIKNENVFDLKFKDCSYEFQIEDDDWVKGTMKGPTDIKAKSTTEFVIPSRVSFKETGKTLFKLLKKGGDVKYNLIMNLVIESDNDMIRNSKAIVKSKGSVGSLVKAAKGFDEEHDINNPDKDKHKNKKKEKEKDKEKQ
jgi:LEA14-like dessication related protein